MAPKPTFTPMKPNGKLMSNTEVEFTPFIYIVGTRTFRLALHRELNRAMPAASKGWVISDPVSGAQIQNVHAYFHGLPVHSRGLGIRAARDAAMATMDTLLNIIGSDKFISAMDAAASKAQEAACPPTSSASADATSPHVVEQAA